MNRRRFLETGAALAAATFTRLPLATATAATFHVSPQGRDDWSGRLPAPNASHTDGPFATPARALKELRRAGGRAITVVLRQGCYALPQPLRFTPEHSGTPDAPHLWTAWPGEHPVLSGGRRLTDWTWAPLERQQQAGGELWMAPLPADANDWNFRQLFVNGRRARRARTPNQGAFTTDGQLSLDAHASFQYRPGEFDPAWAGQPGVELVILQKWAEMRTPIVAADAATRTLTIPHATPAYLREPNARYWVENFFAALDTPGEWFLDRQAGVVYYWPLPGEDMHRAEVIAPRLHQLVRFDGDPSGAHSVHDIHLRGLTLSHADWEMPASGYVDMQAAFDIPAAVEGAGAERCVLENCTLAHLGGYAIAFGRASRHNRVAACELRDLGAGGVKLGDPKLPASAVEGSGEHEVSDTHIHGIGRVYPAAVGIWIGQSAGNRIIHNHIHDTFYTAISVGWTWGYGPTACRDNHIEANHLHHIGQGMLTDLGAVYTLGRQPGTIIRNNLAHDIWAHTYGGWGIYPDEGTSHVLIENNVVYRTKSGGFHQHYGEENTVRNNIFALSAEAQIRRTRGERHLSFRFERNIVYWNEGTLLDGYWGPPQKLVGPQFHSAEDAGLAWNGVEYFFDDNLYWKEGGGAIRFGPWSWQQWRERGEDAHSRIADPGFVDPAAGDFRLKPGSPALALGFEPIDVSRVGPRRRTGA